MGGGVGVGGSDREGLNLSFVFVLGPKMDSRRARRGLKGFLEAVGFILAEFEPKRSHGDPIRDIFHANFQDAIS